MASHQDIILAAVPLAQARKNTADARQAAAEARASARMNAGQSGGRAYADLVKDEVEQAGGNPDFDYSIEELVRQEAVRLTILCQTGSVADKAITQIEDAFAPNPRSGKPSGVLVGDIVKTTFNEHTQRVTVHYKPVVGGRYADKGTGLETITTEPIYNSDGLATANLAKSLKNHRATLYKNSDPFERNGEAKNGKVLRYLVDLGDLKAIGAAN